ncbi:uncharacterized protein LOC117117344 [Anneissia japonica]|uniref:uncharacterized protein LOC117117344 n=1 Tax=Anneissia japonica TaxID=1529436 RepID=UPI00142586F8|nr:uncharacterized protein LOC117117344 [Anneissia japonica]
MGVQIVVLINVLIICFVSASISSVCDNGFQEGPGEHCYYFSSFTTLWASARSACQSVGNGDLTIINGEEELQFLVNQTNILTNTDDDFWWIGYYDVSVEGMWKWVDCSVSSAYQNSLWLSGHPKEDTFDCGAINQNGSLIDYQCDKNLRFICEIIPKEFTRNDTNVQNITGEVLSPTAVQIMWDVSPYSCDIVGYRIHYTDKSSQDDESLSVLGGEVDAANITQLTPGTIYNFTVAALHIDQELARVGPIQLQTEPGDCGPSTLTSDTGNFTSPRYPFDYYEDADCVWTIEVASGKRIVLWFLFAELSDGDYIYFGDGLHIENGTFLMLNASSIESDPGYSSQIRSDSNKVWIRFTSDSTSNGGGFVISYTTEIDCPQDYIVGPNDTCYYFGTELGGYIWSFSRTTCQSVTDGDLVIIDDEEELAFLLEESQKRVSNASWWIGYYDVSVEGTWQWVDCKNSSQFQQDLWAPGEPDNPLDDCGALSFDGTVFEFQCDIRLNYICEVTARDFSQENTNAKNVSASVISSSRLEVSWIPSEYNCDVLGYRVYYYPEFNISDEQAVNVYGGDATDVILTSLQDDTVYIVSVSALAIQEELGRVGDIVVKTSKAPDCPDGYIVGPNDHCYRFSLYENVWDSSRGNCQRAVDGDYVIINDQEELAYLVSEINNRNENYTWWIGLYDVSVERQWSWIDCSSLNTFQQSLWGSQEPNGDYDCGVLRSDGTVAAQQCDMRANHGYICEVNAKEYTIEDTNVQRVHVVPVNESSIHVTWGISNFTCDVLGYRVHFTDISDGLESESISIFPGNASEAILNNLLPFTNYSVAVAALHIDEELSKVGPVFAVTYQGTDCNVMNRPPSTTVTSPSYPAPFSKQECQQYISVPGADGIQLTFHDFETGNEGSELLIGSGLSVDVSTVIYEFTGSMMSNDSKAPNRTTITVFENKLWLYFIGKENPNGEKGFNLSFSAYILSCPTGYIAGPQDHCYKFSTYGEWWVSGRQYDCQASQDGELAIINDEVELEWIVQRAMITDPDVSLWWIGYTRADTNVVEVTAEAVSSSSIRVAWTPSSYTCDVLGYTIRYDHEYNNETISEFEIVNGGNIRSSILQSLIEDTWYTVSVAAMHIEQELDQVGFVKVSTLSGSTQETITTGRHASATTTSSNDQQTTSKEGTTVDASAEPPSTKHTPPTSKQVTNTAKWPSHTTISSVETTPVYPIDSIENGGVDLKLSIAYTKFNATEEEAFRSSIATSTNLYCQQEPDVCMGPPKVVSERDIIVFEMADGSASRRKRRVIGKATTDDSTAVSFFITQAYSSELLMLSDDVQSMLTAYETNIEEDLGYNFELEIDDSTTQTSTSSTTTSRHTTRLIEPVTPVPGTKEPPVLEPWAIALICFAGVCVIVLIVVCFLSARKKKNVKFDGGIELTGGTREAASQARYNDIVAETNRGFVEDK